jgi:hypothetical protein
VSQSLSINTLNLLSLEKFVQKLLGRNDIEDALKRLDTLTMEEARMAISEIRVDVKEVNAVVQRSANIADEEKRSYSDLTVVNSRDLFILTESQLREKLRKWLSPPDPSTNHNIARKAHHEGTASWFFQGSIFEEWKSSPSLLWVHGKRMSLSPSSFTHPADSHIHSGIRQKCPVVRLFVVDVSCTNSNYCSSSGIVEDIMARREAGLAIIAYFYCDFRDEDKQNCRSLVLSIIEQLFTQSNLYCGILSRIYSAHEDGARKPSDETLTKCLTDMLSLPVQSPVCLIVDALDECPNNAGMPTSREEVLDLVKNLVSLCLPNLHICVTSRPELDIQTTLEPLTSLLVSLHNQSGQKKDIVDYLNSVVYSDSKMRRWREEDRRVVIETLSEKADEM